MKVYMIHNNSRGYYSACSICYWGEQIYGTIYTSLTAAHRAYVQIRDKWITESLEIVPFDLVETL